MQIKVCCYKSRSESSESLEDWVTCARILGRADYLEQPEEAEFKGLFHQNEPANLLPGVEEADGSYLEMERSSWDAGRCVHDRCVCVCVPGLIHGSKQHRWEQGALIAADTPTAAEPRRRILDFSFFF